MKCSLGTISKCKVLLLGILVVLCGVEHAIAAQQFSVSPLLIDETTEGRDLFTRTITLQNGQARNTRVYASVHEITLGDKTEILNFVPGSMSNRDTSITSWLEITRGRLEVPAGGSLEVPLTVRVHPNVKPGTYHAFVGFATGANRDEVVETILAGRGTGVIVKLTVGDDVNEQLQLVSFTTDRISLHKDSGNLTFTLENTGDVPVTPDGEVIIYDARGKELAMLPVNSEANTLEPGQRAVFTEQLPFTEHLGRSKAHLTLNYGDQKAAVIDTAFYYSIPWYYIAAVASLFVTVLIVFIALFRRMTRVHDTAYEHGIYEVPLFVRNAKDHTEHDHDINLKHDKSST